MAWFKGIPPVTGTVGPVCIYKMYGRYFMRTRSSLTGERVKKDPAFRKTMEYASLLVKASRMTSAVYAGLPTGQKQHAFYRKLTGEAMNMVGRKKKCCNGCSNAAGRRRSAYFVSTPKNGG